MWASGAAIDAIEPFHKHQKDDDGKLEGGIGLNKAKRVGMKRRSSSLHDGSRAKKRNVLEISAEAPRLAKEQ